MYSSLTSKVLLFVLITAIGVISFIYFFIPINDCDFFWHLKTGELIWQNKSLPLEDPFSYTSRGLVNIREHMVLTSYWISQVIFYLSYLFGGISGIVVLRFVIIGLLVYVMIVRREGDLLIYLGLLLIFLVTNLHLYPVERPQVFSFICFGALLYLLEKVKADSSPGWSSYFFVPLLMLLWANMHGGFILGQATILLYIVLEGIKFTHGSLNPIKKESYKLLVMAGLAGIAISLVNPNTYHVLPGMLSMSSQLTAGITEYQSSYQRFLYSANYAYIFFWLVMFLTAVGLIFNVRRIDITEMALLTGTGYFAFTQIRYIAVFLIAALPVASRYLSNMKPLRTIRGLVIFAALLAGALAIRDEEPNFSLASDQFISDYFPSSAAEFILSNDLKGNMFNFYGWGGYLIWRFGPERKVFIDGRIINEEVYKQFESINNQAYMESFAGISYWESLLDAYGVKYIVYPCFYSTGQIIPLTDILLLQNSEWIPVFFSYNSIVYVKNTPENHDVILKRGIAKGVLMDGLLREADKKILANPRNVTAYIVKGELYLLRTNFKEAKESYEKALKIAPLNPIAINKIRYIQRYEGN